MTERLWPIQRRVCHDLVFRARQVIFSRNGWSETTSGLRAALDKGGGRHAGYSSDGRRGFVHMGQETRFPR